MLLVPQRNVEPPDRIQENEQSGEVVIIYLATWQNQWNLFLGHYCIFFTPFLQTWCSSQEKEIENIRNEGGKCHSDLLSQNFPWPFNHRSVPKLKSLVMHAWSKITFRGIKPSWAPIKNIFFLLLCWFSSASLVVRFHTTGTAIFSFYNARLQHLDKRVIWVFLGHDDRFVGDSSSESDRDK